MRKKRKRSTRSPKPAAKAEPKRGRGRPPYKPTDQERSMVEMMASFRIPEDEMVKVLKNPYTHEPISRMTLRKHFRAQLDSGFVAGKVRLLAATYRDALGQTRTGAQGEQIVDRPGNVTAQIWLQKTLYGMREQMSFDLPLAPEDAAGGEEVTIESARRVAFVLALGAHAVGRKQKPQKKAKTTA